MPFKDTIAYHTHQGLGDLLICSPIVNWMAKNLNKKICYIVRSNLAKNLRRFCVPEVEIVSIENYPPAKNCYPPLEIKIVDEWVRSNNFDLVRSGFSNFVIENHLPWDFYFYKNAGVDYSVKTSHFYVERNQNNENHILNLLKIESGEQYAFVHDDAKRNFEFNPVTNLRIIKNIDTFDIADMFSLLSGAKELHLMGSSLMCYADLLQLPTQNQTAYYYTFRGELPFRGKEKWILVK